MNQDEAKLILEEELKNYRRLTYGDLYSQLDKSACLEKITASGITYQIEIQVFVDDEAKHTLRVMAAIDDGGCRAFIPLCDDFIIAPDGSFVGE